MSAIANVFSQINQWTLSSYWIAYGLANALIIYALGRLVILGYREHPYLYQPGNRRQSFDNWVKFLSPYVARLHLRKYRVFLTLHMRRAAFRSDWDVNDFIALQALYLLAALGISYFFFSVMLNLSVIFVILAAGFFAMLPALRLHDTATQRYISCERDLPFYIDYLSLAMGAGLDFSQAIATVVEDAPKTPLSHEFSLVIRNMRLGQSRGKALEEMSKRLASPQVNYFIQTLIQSMQMGSDVVRTLQVMAESFQTKRFSRAEEKAGKISVQMMIPMMVFVMPSTILILLGPMLLEWFTHSY